MSIKLYPVQQKQVDKSKPNWFYRLSMGTGKTPIAIEHYKKHFNGHKILVVAPKSVELSGSWQETFAKMGVDQKLVKVIRTDAVKKVNPLDMKGVFIIVDEAHKFRTITSQRTKALINLIKKSVGFVLLSGTPVDSKLDNLEAYAIMFGHVKTRKQFKELYMVQKTLPFRPYPFWEVGKNKDKLVGWFHSIASDVLKLDDVTELLPVIENTVHFDKSREYNKSKQSYKKDDKLIFETPTERAWWQRQNQNTNAKIDWLNDNQEELESDGVIVFYNTQSELEALKTVFKDAGEINGSKHVNNKQGAILVQIQAGGAGLNLIEYTHAIWYSLPYSYTDFEQSKFRNYRNGQDKRVTRYYLIVDGTIDDKIMEALNNKIDFNAKLEK